MRRVGVQLPENIAAALSQLCAVVDRLAAAAGAAAGTGHDLDEVILPFAAAPCASISLRVLPRPLTTATRTVPVPGILNMASFQGWLPRTAVKASAGGILAGQQVVSAAQGRVHNAAGGAEDHRRAGAGAQGAVKLRFIQVGPWVRYSSLRIMRGQLPGGQHNVHIRVAAGVMSCSGSVHSAFLAMQGMMETTKILCGSDAQLLGKVALRHRAEHLLGGFRRGEASPRSPGTGIFTKPDPAGAAGGEHGPLVAALLW